MTKEVIKIEMNCCNQQINFYLSKINDLNKKIKELEKAYNRIKIKYNEFSQNNSYKLNRLGKVLTDSGEVPMAKNLYDKMSQMYSGKDFQNADQGFVQTMSEIKRKTVDLCNELDNYSNKLKTQQNQLDYLKQQLLIEMAKEGI